MRRWLPLVPLAGAMLFVLTDGRAASRPSAEHVNRCGGRSMAEFPNGFRDRRNLVVGPLAMSGARTFTTAETVREFGGNKFPLFVRNGRRVTIELTRGSARAAGLSYGSRHGGHRVVRFVACRRNSGSTAGDAPVTFWSGFVTARRPLCVRMRVWVDDEPEPRPAHIELGRRCD
ncbi:MAG TPA: hypothetical protein VM266_16220 [Solirubrobacteraceae bacterium]|nr:hypothetical protein [Solirubrobacteraceae bacterium]